MPWFWGFGWIGALISILFWIGLIVVAVLLLQRELPNFRPRNGSPALDLLEERYARGEIDRQEFLERRAVLLMGPPASDDFVAAGASDQAGSVPPPPAPSTSEAAEVEPAAPPPSPAEAGRVPAESPASPAKPTRRRTSASHSPASEEGAEPTQPLPREGP